MRSADFTWEKEVGEKPHYYLTVKDNAAGTLIRVELDSKAVAHLGQAMLESARTEELLYLPIDEE